MAARKPWPPALLSPTRPRAKTDGDQCADFIEAFCRITKDSIAGRSGEPITLRPWQKPLLRGLLERRPDGHLKHRQALIGMPRKNGKSALASGIALWGLFCGPDGGEVYSCAGDRDQARIVFGAAKRMIEMDAELSGLAKLYRDAVEIPSTGAIYRVLSAEAYTKEGLNPNLVLFDEVHVQPNDDLWNVMALAQGAAVDPLLLGITTAGSRTDTLGRDTLCYRLYQHGRQVAAREVDDPSFFFAWWEPRKGTDCDHTDPAIWQESNPGFGDIVNPEDFESSVKRTPEAEFRTKRTNVWVVSSSSALPHGAWDACEAPDEHPGSDEVLFCDGSWSGDSTGILSITVSARPHITVVDLWEKPGNAEGWRVPIEEVEATLKRYAREHPVVGVAFDPFRWQRSMQVLESEGLPVVEFPQSNARLTPAWKAFYDAVLDQGISHDGDPRLSRHIENMRLKIDQNGARPVKETSTSTRHIDLGVCAMCGLAEVQARLGAESVPEPFAIYV